MGEQVKVCLECGEEYQLHVARCADCGGALEEREAPATRGFWERTSRPEPDPEPEPPGDWEALGSDARAAELVPLADRLQAAGVPVRLRPRQPEPGEHEHGFEIVVRREDRERALAEMAALEGLPEGGGKEAFDAQEGYLACPACAAALPAGAEECPDCGLAIR